MALWNEKDSRWDNVPDADLTFSDYVTKLLRQPSTFARPAFGGPFASTAQPAPVADQTKMEGMFEEYLKGKQQPTSSFRQQESLNPKWDAMTDAEKAAWYAENPNAAAFTRTLQDIWTDGGARFVSPLLGLAAKAQGMFAPDFVNQQRAIANGYYADPTGSAPAYAAWMNSGPGQQYAAMANSGTAPAYASWMASQGITPITSMPETTQVVSGTDNYNNPYSVEVNAVPSSPVSTESYRDYGNYGNSNNSGWSSSDSYSGWSPGSSTD
jgi:hypothetical protein